MKELKYRVTKVDKGESGSFSFSLPDKPEHSGEYNLAYAYAMALRVLGYELDIVKESA